MLFSSKQVLKSAIKNVAIKDRVQIKFQKNDKVRLRVVCKPGCEWMLYGSKFKVQENDTTFQIKTFISTHSCCKEYGNRNMDYKWLADKYLHCFLADPTLSIPSFAHLVYKDFVINVPPMKLWRAKNFALQKLQGTYDNQYSSIGKYAVELKRVDPRNNVLCKLDLRIFQRLFVALGPCLEGMKLCRPLIGLDGTFLKGKYGGQLLAAVGLDANNCIFPIAFSVVEIENTETWTWFINLIKEHLQMENPYNWTWMSDRQKV
ncbi:unnamed protein product [Cuscuta epithymum]|uniref:MULE transposase domain-containing protein n=1 Tax=Cuscuta epithymum TaxID=186058 RepID=A0AAV0C0X6_9ASTE|nr:unnamed protein product [Cuscuta epithymum]